MAGLLFGMREMRSGLWLNHPRQSFKQGSCHILRGRGKIKVKCLGFGRGAAPGSGRKHTDHPGLCPHRKDQHIAGADGMAGLGLALPVQTQAALGDNARCKAASLEKPGIEQPFVEPHLARGGGTLCVFRRLGLVCLVASLRQRLRSFPSRLPKPRKDCPGRSFSRAAQGVIRIFVGQIAKACPVVCRLCPCL